MSARRVRDGAFLLVLVLTVGVLAAFHQGIPTSQLELNDGGVWVTNDALHLAAHLNYPSRSLDGGVQSAASALDVAQDANDVMLRNASTGAYQPVNTATLVLGSNISVPATFESSRGGHTLAVSDPKTGKVWALDSQSTTDFSSSAPVTTKVSPGQRVLVGTDGAVNVVGGDGSVTRVTGSDGAWAVAGDGSLQGFARGHQLTLTAVGDQVVAFDKQSSKVLTLNGSSVVPGPATFVLQQPGPASDVVQGANDQQAVTIPLDGSGIHTQDAGTAGAGLASAPVVLNGCTYFAWSGSGNYRRDCADDSNDTATTSPVVAKAGTPVFRVNRDVVVLNSTDNGDVILVNQNMTVVSNWQDVQSQIEDQKKRSDKQSTAKQVVQNKEANKDKSNHDPVANPDDFGVRPGRTTTLPVLLNDSDSDGDILVASTSSTKTTLGTVGQSGGGQALQITTPANATGSASFPYQANDGRGGQGSSTVKVTIHPFSGKNEAPTQLRDPQVTLAQGAQITYDALQDWIDPDGDDVYLQSASSVKGLTVSSNAQGAVTVRAAGDASPGVAKVPVVVSDGTASSSAFLIVVVKASGNEPPIANTDFVQATTGVGVRIEPLANDTDPNGDVLQLVSASAPGESGSVTTDFDNGAFTFTPSRAGTVYLPYSVSDGKNSTPGRVRVDVKDSGGSSKAPVASPDVAMLPQGGSVLADVLTNDSDPAGGVLVLQSVSLPTGSPLQVEVVARSQLRISAPAGLPSPATFTYSVSNGSGAATGQVTVIQVPVPAKVPSPVAKDDTATVRAGDVTTVDVLANDDSPAGLSLSVDPKLEVVGRSGLGEAFVSQDKVRFKAGNTAGDVHITYTVKDPRGNFDSADVHITIQPVSKQNSPPTPRPLTMRVLAGGSMSLPVPLDGIDPDGDSVTLTGVSQPPTKGTALIKDGSLVYTAANGSSGSDSFVYQVADRFGATGSATVKVGIAPATAQNQPPVAVADAIVARTGRTLSLPVLANDFDPDGDQVALTAGSVRPVDASTKVVAKTAGSRVDLTTPTAPARLRYYYDINDGKGGVARGVLTVDVRTTAPLLAPIARDDVLDAAAVLGKNKVDVDVLANDEDPDGSVAALKVSTTAAGVTVAANRHLSIPVTSDRQVILYSVTDPDGLVGSAVVVVPGASGQPPTLRSNKVPLKMDAGKTATVGLADYVAVRSGHSPILQSAASVKGGAGITAQVTDARTIKVTAGATASGPTFVSFVVTDGANANDPQGKQATITLPVEVKAAAAQVIPVFRPTAVQVAVSEPAISVDLAPMVSGLEPAQRSALRFAAGSATGSITASLAGSVVKVAAKTGATAGSSGQLPVTVSVTGGKSVTGTLQVTVVSSTRPRMDVTPAVLTADAGKPVSVDVTQYVTNPFADQGKPITLVGTPSVSTGTGSARAAGLTITITPGADFHGQLTATYRVADASGQADRQVQGQISVNVRGKPAAPTITNAITNASHTSTVSWVPGDNNGSPITGFTVNWSGGSKACGTVTSCTITGLANNVAYHFTVIAHNEVGDSPASAPSAEIKPDQKPDAPVMGTADFGDKQVSLSWAAARVDGSPVTTYTVYSASGGSKPVTGTSAIMTGLTNGTNACFTVSATNKAGESTRSTQACAVPRGAPSGVTGLAASFSPSSALQQQVVLTWGAADANGAPGGVTYSVTEDGAATGCTQSGCSLNVPSKGNVTFGVTAHNSAKEPNGPAVSTTVQVYGAASAPTGLAVTPTGQDNTITVRFSPPGQLNGASASQVSYQWEAGGASGSVTSGQAITNGVFHNGDDVPVIVRSITHGPSGAVSGGAATGTVNAFGPPVAPTISCSPDGQNINCHWQDGNGNGRGASYALSDGASGPVGPSGDRSFNVGYSVTKTYCVSITQDGTSTTKTNCSGSIRTPDAPAEAAFTGQSGGQATLTMQNFSGPVGQYKIRCWNANGSADHNWNSNYLGETQVYLPLNGTVAFTCPTNPKPGPFSVEVVGRIWAQPTTWR